MNSDLDAVPPFGGQYRGPVDGLAVAEGQSLSASQLLQTLRANGLLLVLGPLTAGAVAFVVTMLIPPTFTASTTFMPPQQQQSAVASALSSLGPLAGLAGGSASTRNPADQFVALMQSTTVSDRIVAKFNLMRVFDAQFKVDARRELEARARISVGKKDGLILVEIDDTDPARGAAMANQYVEELRLLTSSLAVTEAQQRRVFFGAQLEKSRDNLTKAQQALQSSGFNSGALRAEPKAAAESYGRLKAESIAAEVRLQTLRQSLADNTPEIQREQATLSALRGQLARVEQPATAEGPDYIGKYRDFKYQETLFELFARQYELARVDESKEGSLIQVIDTATPPERKSKPKRAMIAIGTALVAWITLLTWVLLRASMRRTRPAPAVTAAAA